MHLTIPIENKVFDVTLLLEKIVADFNDFRTKVKNKVYELLTYSVLGVQIDQFADWVWSVLDEYGFGTIEKIINFFEQEDMQNRLANIILDEEEQSPDNFQCQLNLDTPLTEEQNCYDPNESLDYKAVTKVGILTFAGHIHDIYIADDGWREDTWNWIFDPGYTLVDLVDAALGAVGGAISAVKNAATNFVNGIRAGMSFIQNQIMTKIVDMLSFAVEMVFKSFTEIIASQVDGVRISHSDGRLLTNINGNSFPIYISESNNRIIIDLAGQKIENGLFDGHYEVETLGLGLDYAKDDLNSLEFSLFVNIITIGITLLAVKAPHPFTVIPAVIGLFSSIIMK